MVEPENLKCSFRVKLRQFAGADRLSDPPGFGVDPTLKFARVFLAHQSFRLLGNINALANHPFDIVSSKVVEEHLGDREGMLNFQPLKGDLDRDLSGVFREPPENIGSGGLAAMLARAGELKPRRECLNKEF